LRTEGEFQIIDEADPLAWKIHDKQVESLKKAMCETLPLIAGWIEVGRLVGFEREGTVNRYMFKTSLTINGQKLLIWMAFGTELVDLKQELKPYIQQRVTNAIAGGIAEWRPEFGKKK
jgi:hypothetical protein